MKNIVTIAHQSNGLKMEWSNRNPVKRKLKVRNCFQAKLEQNNQPRDSKHFVLMQQKVWELQISCLLQALKFWSPFLQVTQSKLPTRAKGEWFQNCFLVQMSESDPGLGYSNLSFVITNQLMPNTAGEENERVIIFFYILHPEIISITWVTITVLVCSFICLKWSSMESRNELCASGGSSWNANWIFVLNVWAPK